MGPESFEDDPGVHSRNRVADAVRIAGSLLLGALLLSEVIAPTVTDVASDPGAFVVEVGETFVDEIIHA
jgi:hypothetical protein